MKKLLTTVFVLFIGLLPAFAQSILLHDAVKSIEGLSCTGVSTFIELDKKAVEKAWAKKLKEFGKVETTRKAVLVRVALIPEISPNAIKLYSTLEPSAKGVTVFYALDLGDGFITPTLPEYEITRKILSDFAQSLYHDDMAEQVKETERAVMFTQKQYEKKTEEGKNLADKIEKNAADKIRLEKLLYENTQQAQRLKQELEQNKHQQEAMAEEATKVKKLSEDKKKKLEQLKKPML
jgi:hypothetical protein